MDSCFQPWIGTPALLDGEIQFMMVFAACMLHVHQGEYGRDFLIPLVLVQRIYRSL